MRVNYAPPDSARDEAVLVNYFVDAALAWDAVSRAILGAVFAGEDSVRASNIAAHTTESAILVVDLMSGGRLNFHERTKSTEPQPEAPEASPDVAALIEKNAQPTKEE